MRLGVGRFLAPLVGSLLLGSGFSLSSDDTTDLATAKNRPVSKVITLLKDMLKQLEAEAEQDQEIYDKLACWCETNDREKTKSIKEAEARIEALTTKIEQLTAESARLTTEIKALEKEVEANQAALAQATALREKQLAEFNAEEKELLESISALKAAITVLEKHHRGSAFLQVPRTHMMGVAATLQHELSQHSSLLEGILTPAQRRTAASFLQAPQDYFDATPTFKQAYAPQSGEIFGILRQMRETFEANLSESQKQEMEDQKVYEEVKAAKEQEIAAGQAQINRKRDELADVNDRNAQAKQDLEDTKASLSADEKFLMMLKEHCAMTDKEWEERQNTRQLEMSAVSKALAVLSGDDAHDLFTRTFNPSFLQVNSAESQRRAAASTLLSRVARSTHSPKLATLAYRVKLDAFARVKEAIDKMIAELLKEKADEIKHKDFCVTEFNANQLQTEKKTREKKDLIAIIETLETDIANLTKEIARLKAEIAEMQVQLKRAGEDREKENKEFQSTVADQRETQRLLTLALGHLQEFYGKAALVQKQEPVGPPPPPGFDAYKKNDAHGGVIDLIKQIREDAKAMEGEAIRSEEDAQKAYEDFVKETNNSIESKTRDIVSKSKIKAQKEVELVDAKKDKAAVMLELEQLSNYDAQLHQSCDFVMRNFDLRQTARDQEVEALRQAKAILSGAKFEEFLQQ